MAITLQQVAQASQSTLKQGFVENIIETSPVLAKIPFVDAPSLRYEWSLQKLLPATGFRALNTNYAATQSTYDRGKIDLKPLGGEFRIDRLLKDIPDLNMARFYETEIRARARSASMGFKKALVKGSIAVDPAEFDGLQKWFDDGTLTTEVQLAAGGTTFTALGGQATVQKMHDFINACIVTPDIILANRTIISNLAALAISTAANNVFAQYFQMSFMDIGNGRKVSVGSFNGIPIIAMDTDELGNEILSFTETSQNLASSITCSMYALTLGENYFTGLQQTNEGPRTFEYVTDSGHTAFAIDWPAAIAVEHPRAVSRLRGILAA